MERLAKEPVILRRLVCCWYGTFRGDAINKHGIDHLSPCFLSSYPSRCMEIGGTSSCGPNPSRRIAGITRPHSERLDRSGRAIKEGEKVDGRLGELDGWARSFRSGWRVFIYGGTVQMGTVVVRISNERRCNKYSTVE